MVEPAATVQLFGVCAGVVVGLHNLSVEADKVAPVAAASFERMFVDCAVRYGPEVESAVAVGAATTVGVTVDVALEPAESVIWYATGVAVPVNAPVQPAPAGVFAAEHGVKITLEPESVYVPCPETVFEVSVQPLAGLSVVQKLMVGDVMFAPVDAVSFDFTLIVWAAPCAPVEVSADASAGVV